MGCRIRRLSVLVLAISMLALSGPAVLADGPITTIASTTTSEFPQALVFQLTAASSAADIVKVELRFKLRGDASTEVARPEFTPGRRIEATYRWKTDKTQIPPGAPVEFRWVITDGAGNTLTTDQQTAIYDDLRFPWKHLQNDEIAFYWYEGSDEFGQTVFDVAARSLVRISTDIGAKVKYPIRIYAYANQEDFRSAFPSLGNTYQWIGGQAFVEQAITVQILPDEGEDTSWIRDVIPHEISHLVFHQATDHPLADPPTWLNEGLAQHNEEGDLAYLEAMVRAAARSGKLFPLKMLSGSFFNDPEKTYLAYAESYSAVQYIFRTYGREGMARLIAAFGAGKMREAAFQEALGISLDELDRDWQRSVGATPATATPVLTPTATPDRPWLNPTLPPWAQKGTGTPVTATPTRPPASQTPPPTPRSAETPVPAPASTVPLWPAVVGGGLCCASVALAVIFLIGLVWWIRRPS